MAERYGTKPIVEVDGAPIAEDPEPIEVVVDDHLFMPDMFAIRFRDPDRTVLERSGIRPSSKVKIKAAPLDRSAPELLIAGEVVALEGDFDGDGGHVVVRGYDESHRLHRGRRTETYRDVTDGDIASQIAARVGLDTGRIEDGSGPHEHVSQANLTDFEFLHARAREIGYEVAVVDGALQFRPPESASNAPETGDRESTDPLQLALGTDLEVFRPRLTSAEQVKEVQVRGWDPTTKQVVVGIAPGRTESVALDDRSFTPQDLAESFGDPVYVVADRALATQSEVDVAAGSLAEQIAGSFVEAEGIALGDPKLKAGSPVSIAMAGKPFDGRYTLTQTRHLFDERGYKTWFVVSGRQERSLLGLATMGATGGAASAGGPPIYGVVVGKVTDVEDPQGMGRVRLGLPQISDDFETDWVRRVEVDASRDTGSCFIPEVGDEVLVAFENGDIRRPYVLGGLHNGEDEPQLGGGLFDNGRVTRRGFISRANHKLVFFDGRGKEGIAILTGDDALRISLNETEREVKVTSDGTVTIRGVRDIAVEGDADVSVRAGARLRLEGAQVDIEASGPLAVKGNPIRLN